MRMTLGQYELGAYISKQLNTFFPDKIIITSEILGFVESALIRMAINLSHHKYSLYSNNDSSIEFSHLHSNQYAMFLWILSNTVYRSSGNLNLATKLFYLNKALHSIECMYDAELPEIFYFSHTVGLVLGKAKYSNFLVVSQGCTIGQHHGIYPKIGEWFMLGAGASVIGNCSIGDHVTIGSNTNIFEAELASNTTSYIKSGEVVTRISAQSGASLFFNHHV